LGGGKTAEEVKDILNKLGPEQLEQVKKVIEEKEKQKRSVLEIRCRLGTVDGIIFNREVRPALERVGTTFDGGVARVPLQAAAELPLKVLERLARWERNGKINTKVKKSS
jgi:histidinol dehydrogenase